MTAITYSDVRAFLMEYLTEHLPREGKLVPHDLGDDYDLFLSGTLDSLGLLELTVALSDFCGREIDFSTIDPNDITIVGPLSRFVAAQGAGTS